MTTRHQAWYRVYPRVCGGTEGGTARILSPDGLSPRVRGNLRRAKSDDCQDRSIPACAGEPCSTARLRFRLGVYPRVCGGTYIDSILSTMPLGLSPRVRGNRRR